MTDTTDMAARVPFDRAEAKREARCTVIVVSHRFRDSIVCFPRTIAAQATQRRGVSMTLYYGAMQHPERGLTTHVWIQVGEDGISN